MRKSIANLSDEHCIAETIKAETLTYGDAIDVENTALCTFVF